MPVAFSCHMGWGRFNLLAIIEKVDTPGDVILRGIIAATIAGNRVGSLIGDLLFKKPAYCAAGMFFKEERRPVFNLPGNA